MLVNNSEIKWEMTLCHSDVISSDFSTTPPYMPYNVVVHAAMWGQFSNDGMKQKQSNLIL